MQANGLFSANVTCDRGEVSSGSQPALLGPGQSTAFTFDVLVLSNTTEAIQCVVEQSIHHQALWSTRGKSNACIVSLPATFATTATSSSADTSMYLALAASAGSVGLIGIAIVCIYLIDYCKLHK